MKTAADFQSKKEFFAYLVTNKSDLAEMKKAARKFTDAFGTTPLQANANKALNTNYQDDVESGKIRRTIILNTYNYLDSHDDVHMDGVFADSIKDRQDKIWHLHDHQYQLTSKVGKPSAIYEKKVSWADLGVNKAGDTTALFMDTDIIKGWNEKIFQMYLTKEIQQHSVGMRYGHIELAINDPEMKEEYAVWNKCIDHIGNKEKALEQGYFWAVSKAELYEGSCVLEGSNQLTPTVNNEPKAKPEEEPPAPVPSFYTKLVQHINTPRF
jgi:hypothetical protein